MINIKKEMMQFYLLTLAEVIHESKYKGAIFVHIDDNAFDLLQEFKDYGDFYDGLTNQQVALFMLLVREAI